MDKNDNNEEDSRQDFVLKSISRIIEIFRENDFNERKKNMTKHLLFTNNFDGKFAPRA